MAQERLDRILRVLKTEDMAQAPLGATADRIEMLAAEDLEKLRKTEDAGKLSSLVRNWYTAADAARAEDKRQWYKDLDMAQGRQFTEWDSTRGMMREIPAPDYEPRIAVNIIEPICRTEMAKTGSTHPSASVSPASNDQSDIMAARAAEAAWDWFYVTSKFQTRVFTPANFWRTHTGNGFIKTYWDSSAVDESATAAAEMQAAELTAQQSAQGIAFPATPPAPVQGKLKTQYVTPFHLLVPDLTELDLQQQAYLLHTYLLPVEQAKAAYEEFLPKDWQPTLISGSSIMNTVHLGVKGGNGAKLDSVQVIEAWIKPNITKLLPKGGLVVVVGDQLAGMSADGLPYKHGEFPFVHLTGIETGRFYRKSIVASITPLQNELNRTYAQIIKAKNLMTKPMFFYDEGSVDPRRIRNKAGTYIPIRLGMRYPQPVPITELPSYVLDLVERIKGHLDDISGQHQVSRAISPGADTAASALALLQETDDNFLAPTFDSIIAAMETIARQSLSLMVQFWDEPRLVKVTGDETGFDAKMLSSADLKNGTDIRIDSESSLPKSRSARIAQITEWIDKGIIPPEAGLEAMEMGTLGKVYQRIKLDKDAARRENIKIRDLDVAELTAHYQQQEEAIAQATAQLPGIAAEQGIPPEMAAQTPPPEPELFFPIGWMDNDAVHSEEHRAYAKSQEYDNLPEEIKQELQRHTEAHDARLAQQQMQAAQMGADPNVPGAAQPDGYAESEPQAA